MSGAVYRETEWTLDRSERLIAFSDGLIERRTEDILVSRDRLAAAIMAGPNGDAEDLWQVMRGGSAFDDATALVVQRRG